METGRLEAFSDGVFAIAITLLILEVRIPHAGEGHLWHEIGQLWPQFAAYVTSFLTIGIIWINHHAQFRQIERADPVLQVINLLLLLCVSFIPWPTAVLAEFLRAGSDQHAAAAVYAGTFLVTSLTFYAMWRHAGRASLLGPGLGPAQLARLTRRNQVGHVGYAAATVLAFVWAPLSLAICAAVALFYLRPASPAPA